MKKNSIRTLIIVGFLLFVGIKIFYGPSGLINQYRVSKQNQDLIHSIDSLTEVLKHKDEEILRLQSDTAFLEILARTRLGMSKKEEKVYQFIKRDP
jgi:cell division protein FtsB